VARATDLVRGFLVVLTAIGALLLAAVAFVLRAGSGR
jgi:hypothetical protein